MPRNLIVCTLRCFSLLLVSATVLSQDTSNVEIDPRKYVSLIYKKGSAQGKFDTIWSWEKRKGVPNQKFYTLDHEGEVNIIFHKAELISNMDFEGTFSLEAEISGSNGTRRIEVNPYSEIGVQRMPIGVKSEPPSEISKKLLNMLLELSDADRVYRNIETSASFLRRRDNVPRYLHRIRELDSIARIRDVNTESLLSEATALKRHIMADYAYSYQSEIRSMDSVRTPTELRAKLEAVKNYIEKDYANDQDYYIRDFKAGLIYINQKTDIVLEYLNSFESAGEDATKAFLSLINKDLISYRALKAGLMERQALLRLIDIRNLQDNDSRLDTIFSRNAATILNVSDYLSDLARFKGSQLEVIIKDYGASRNLDSVYSKELSLYSGEEKETALYKEILDDYLEEISEEVSIRAGRIIYKRLVYGTIDLGKSGAKNGEVLNVYVTWILDSKRDSLSNSPRLPVGRYFLRKTGWEFDVADMFAMVKRVNEDDVNQAEVSPSNFKGSGGAVLMWTYNRRDKGLEVKPKGSEFTVNRRGKLANFFEPSIGLNVSYLDFSTTKDVEIGVGLQLGLFRNKIFFGYGANLHMLSPKDQSPTYFYLGFSFARLSDLFKNSSSVMSLQ